MKVTPLNIPEVLLVELKVFRDERGFFMERFQETRFQDFGLPVSFVQDNHSRSVPRVLRGLHMQNDPAQGKLVGVTRGKIWDVAVDLRPGSATYGQWAGAELSAESGTMLWIPAGFAHGFCVVGDEETDVLYKVTGTYNPKSETGIRWNDPSLAIAWPVKDPIISAKDQQLPLLKN